jgi:hypothetical protein
MPPLITLINLGLFCQHTTYKRKFMQFNISECDFTTRCAGSRAMGLADHFVRSADVALPMPQFGT